MNRTNGARPTARRDAPELSNAQRIRRARESRKPRTSGAMTPNHWFARKFPRLADEYGDSVLEAADEAGIVSARDIGEDFLAATLGERGSPDAPTVFLPAEERFYAYDGTEGIFIQQREPVLLARLSRWRNKLGVAFDPSATCPMFLDKLMRPALNRDGLDLLQRWCGLALLAENLAQKMVILSGTAGGGKGTFIRVLTGIIGQGNLATFRPQLLGERFEIGRFLGRTLLYGADVPESFLNQRGASVLKSLTWMLTGLDHLRADNWRLRLAARQQALVDNLLLESDGHAIFVRECLKRQPSTSLTVEACYAAYVTFCNQRGWSALARNKFGALIADLILHQFGIAASHDIRDGGGGAQRGWRGLNLSHATEEKASEASANLCGHPNSDTSDGAFAVGRTSVLPADCLPWLHVARQVLAGEFDAADGSTSESLAIGLRGITHPLCRKALERLRKARRRL